MNLEQQQLQDFHRMVAGARQRPNGLRLARLLRELPYMQRHFMGNRLIWMGLVLMVVSLLLLSAAPASAAVAVTSYDAGLEAVSEQRYRDAVLLFQRAAEQGDREAMRNLGLMLLYGEALYGQQVKRQPELARRWLQAAAARGCEISTHMCRRMGWTWQSSL